MLHIGRNIFSMVISRIVAALILFLIYTKLAQYLGPVAAGQFGLFAGYLTVFSLFVDIGMTKLVVKKVSEDKSNASKYINNYFSVQFFMGLMFMLIMTAVVHLADYPELVERSLYVVAFGLFLSSLSLPFRSNVNAFQKMTYIAGVNFANSAINAAFMILAIVFRTNIFFLAFVSVAVGLFDAL